jgi:hypothetical protein
VVSVKTRRLSTDRTIMQFADMGKATLRGGRTYSAAEVALLAAHIDLTEAELREVSQRVAQVEWDQARLRSALARTAVAVVAAMSAGPRPAGERDVLHGVVDRCSAVRSEVLTAAREHAAVYPR